MCPSYMVTREEEHSTRGRARMLFEMLDGTARGGAIDDGWRSDAVRDALDLCLACKGCARPTVRSTSTWRRTRPSSCITTTRTALRPRSHYSMGWLPLAAAAASRMPRVANAVAHAPLLARCEEGRRLRQTTNVATVRARDVPTMVPRVTRPQAQARAAT